MKKYARVINEETKLCEVGLGTNTDFYKSIGMTEQDIEQAYDGSWYISGYAPVKPEPTKADIEQARASRYATEVDPMTSEINRLRDEEQTPEVMARIAELILARKDAVAKIKADLPYPVEETTMEEKHEETPTDVTK